MIYTVTFNPAIDYVIYVDDLKTGAVNRAIKEEVFYGGKGINVSVVLQRLGYVSSALGFVAGFTGDAIEKGIKECGIETDFIRLNEGFSRINLKIKSGEETELNGQGPYISREHIDQLFLKLGKLKTNDTLVLAGSIPKCLPEDIYEQILKRLSNKGIRFVVDATKELLLNVLKYHPFLIKPNDIELGEMFSKELKTDKEIIEHAKKLQKKGARNVLVSMAGNGSLLIDEEGGVTKTGVPKGRVINSVGAGDSMVAGFLAGYLKTESYEEALKLGAAAGSATAYSEGLCEKNDIDRLIKELKPVKINEE